MSVVERLLNKVRAEKQPDRKLLIFVGAISSSDSPEATIYNNAYLTNVAEVVRVLNNSHVIAGHSANFSRDGFQNLGQIPKSQLGFGVDEVVRTNDLYHHAYPRNVMAPSKNALVVKSLSRLHHKISKSTQILQDDNLSVGGIYSGAETGDLVFVALPKTRRSVSEEKLLREQIFPDKTVIVVPTPHATGVKALMADQRRVVEHIDQFVAHPLPLSENRGYLVAIDSNFFSHLDNNGFLPRQMADGREIVYVAIDHRFTSANHILNTLASPSGEIFVEPDLKVALQEQNKWGLLDTSTIHVLPSNIPAYDSNSAGRAGLGCRVVIAAA